LNNVTNEDWHGEYHQPGEFVLVQNSRFEKELDRKTKPCYLGPFEIVQHTQGRSYILKEMDGMISQHGVAAFQLLPYHTWEGAPLPITEL